MTTTPCTSPRSENDDWLPKLFNRPLVDLGADGNDRLKTIYSPVYDKSELARFMTSYYDSDAGVESQVSKFDLTSYYDVLLRESLARARPAGWPEAVTILELGCGFGSATIPLARTFPKARLVASEFSVPMLCALKRMLSKHEVPAAVCTLMQLNAEDLDFKPASFDLVVGAAILHHLFHPESLIAQCQRILKPGGCAIFYEPFEIGTGILTLLYRTILRDPRARSWWRGLSRRQRKYLRGCIAVWQKNKNPDKADPYFATTDDKWVFTRDFLETHALAAGFDRCVIYPLEKSGTPLAALFKVHTEGNNIRGLPAWVHEIVDEFEASFSPAAKRDLLTEGCILLLKNEHACP
jgi:ubiquinone/menaquinone biosynthesis C-methylase UbiE